MNTTEAYSPGLEGINAGITQISQVDSERQTLIYRGYAIHDLVERSTYEEVAYLLLYGHLPAKAEYEAFLKTLRQESTHIPAQVIESMKHFPKEASKMDQLRCAAAIAAMYDPEANDHSSEANLRKAVRLIAQFPAFITYPYHITLGKSVIPADPTLNHAENFLYMLTGKKPDPFIARIFDQSLIAYADHGFNASTFTARVTVSTLSDLHSGVISALGALKGPLHGGANEEAMKMLLEISTPQRASVWMHDALATKKKIMGFGHREYKHGDPRATIMTALGRKLAERMGQFQWVDMAEIVAEVMLREKNIYPNVDFPTGYIYYMMGLPIDIYTPIFALSRVAGWSAHIVEQLENNRLIRPKAIYEGPEYREYTPLDQRK